VPSSRFRLVVLGLDSVSPDLLYRRFAPAMPRLGALLARSAKGTLHSCDPPITVPAWAVMFSGVDPGTLGLYGFRHRRPGTYDQMYVPNSSTARHPMIWQILSRLGYRVAVLGMPPGYPPLTLNGVAISDFLTPDSATDYVNPSFYRSEVDRVSGGPFFDIPFRVEERKRVAEELFTMTRRRWRVARHLWDKEPWDLFVVHDIGPDRLHHAFWKYFDPEHPRHPAGSEFANIGEEFYRLLDEELGEFLDHVGPEVAVLVASDHGSQPMGGCFAVNEWLQREGYLRLKGTYPPGTPLERTAVDWARTKVWGAGGYYARLFLNVRGREPEGIVEPRDVPELVRTLREGLSALRTPGGATLPVRLFRPEEVYRAVEGDPPDLMAYFDETRWRSAGTVGHPGLFLEENDTGPDDAVHSFDGVLAFRDPSSAVATDLGTQQIIDVAPTLLRRFGVPIPESVQGRPIPSLV
jgi:predicted AlkP superfamily phosphohydrolase/phosphomutase